MRCPTCQRELTETPGYFQPGGRFQRKKAGASVIRTHCIYCSRFIGYRPTDPTKLKGRKRAAFAN